MLGTRKRSGCKKFLFLIDYQMFPTVDKAKPERAEIKRRFVKLKRRFRKLNRRFIFVEQPLVKNIL